jgi:hypothetical protein
MMEWPQPVFDHFIGLEKFLYDQSRTVFAVCTTVFLFVFSTSSEAEVVDHGHVQPFYQEGEMCSQVARFDSTAVWTVREVKDGDNGTVEQEFDSFGQFGEEFGGQIGIFFYDCNSNSVIGLGLIPEPGEAGVVNEHNEPFEALVRLVRASRDKGSQLPLSEIERLAVQNGVSHTQLIPTNETVGFGAAQYSLSCACQLYYPDSPGASQ